MGKDKYIAKLSVFKRQVPILAYLLVLLFAFLIGDILDFNRTVHFFIYSSLVAFFILSLQCGYKIYLLAFFFCASLIYYDYRDERIPPNFAVIDANLDLEILAINTTNDRYISGFANVFTCDAFEADLLGSEIFFVIYTQTSEVYDIGSKLHLYGTLHPVGNISAFDNFLARKKVFYRLVVDEEHIEPLPIGHFSRSVQSIRRYITANIANSSDSLSAYLPLYRALMIGDMSMVAKVDKNKFARSGSIHIFAISGLHVGLVASLLFFIFKTLGLRYSISMLLSLGLLYLYVQVCGAKPSAVRAYMMIFFVALAFGLKRRADSFNALLLSAIFALLYDPKLLFNIGFLLSYTVVGSIILYALPLFDYLKMKYSPYAMLPERLMTLPKRAKRSFYLYLLMSFCVSFSALLGGGILCSYFFGYIAWASLINFILFVPLVSLILILGFSSLLMPDVVASLVNDFILHLLKFMSSVAKFFSDANFVIEIKVEQVSILIFGIFVYFTALIYLRDKRDLRLLYVPVFIFSFILLISKISLAYF